MAEGFYLTITRKKLKKALEANLDAKYTDGRVNEIYQALKAYRMGRPGKDDSARS